MIVKNIIKLDKIKSYNEKIENSLIKKSVPEEDANDKYSDMVFAKNPNVNKSIKENSNINNLSPRENEKIKKDEIIENPNTKINDKENK